MKKLLSVVLSLCMVCAMALSLAACGSGDKDNSSSSQPSSSQADPSSSEESSATGKYATIQEFIDSDMMQKELEGVISEVKDAGMELKVYAEGNDKFVYEYTFNSDMSSIADSLKEAIETEADTFKNVAKTVPLAVDVDSVTVIVKYLNPDGSEVCVSEFTAD